MKDKKQLKELLVVLFVTLVFTVAVSDFLYSNPQIKFVVGEYTKTADTKAKLLEAECETEEISFDELFADSRCETDQSLMLINSENKIKDAFVPELVYYRETVQMNSCITEAYASLAEEISQNFGEKLYISSAYRTDGEQQQLAQDNAYAAEEGASEHEAGLALDVYVPHHSGKAFLKSEAGRYVNSDCWRHGFIIRYPYYGKKITGIKYEPWHLRFVGLPHSEIIYKNRLTLEQYIDKLEYGRLYSWDGYIVTRQTGKTAIVPAYYSFVTVSPDNAGGYVCTFLIK